MRDNAWTNISLLTIIYSWFKATRTDLKLKEEFPNEREKGEEGICIDDIKVCIHLEIVSAHSEVSTLHAQKGIVEEKEKQKKIIPSNP